MFYLLILLISLCDIYPVPDDPFFEDFAVSKQLDDKWFGCVESPFSAKTVDLAIPRHESIEPVDESPHNSNLVFSNTEKIPVMQLQQAAKDVIPPKPPDEPLFFMTPEPAAIIVLPGLLLLFLLFGKRRLPY